MLPTRSEQFDKIFDAIIAARETFPSIPQSKQTFVGKDANGKGIFRPYSSFEDIWSAVKEPLKKQNVHVTISTSMDAGQHLAEIFMLHRPSLQWLRSLYAIDGDGGKSPQQGRGISQTYASRYCIKNMLMLDIEDETDTDAEPITKDTMVAKSPSTKPKHIARVWSFIYKEEDIKQRGTLIKDLCSQIGKTNINDFSEKDSAEAIEMLEEYFK